MLTTHISSLKLGYEENENSAKKKKKNSPSYKALRSGRAIYIV